VVVGGWWRTECGLVRVGGWSAADSGRGGLLGSDYGVVKGVGAFGMTLIIVRNVRGVFWQMGADGRHAVGGWRVGCPDDVGCGRQVGR